MTQAQVLTLPGWRSSNAEHWQSQWESLYAYQRVEQHDWIQPRRGDWLARLEETVIDADEQRPLVLVAHSLGCILVAAWAQFSHHAHKVHGAFLVAPGDIEHHDLKDFLPSWLPIGRQKLPFPSVLVASRNDPYCRFERAEEFAQAWGSRLIDAGLQGHLNAEAGLGDWPEGHAWLQTELLNIIGR